MRTIRESSYQKRLKMLSSIPAIIPAWLLTDWLGRPSTEYAPDHQTPLMRIIGMYLIGASRPIHNPAGQPASYQNSKSLPDYLNA